MQSIYSMSVSQLQEVSGIPLTVVETDIDLYYQMALSMYTLIERQNNKHEPTTMILPVGPVFQYRRFISLLNHRPLNLSGVHLFFMDEYLVDGTDTWIDEHDPLSFRGFIRRELIDPMPRKMGLEIDQIHFPDPKEPRQYDDLLDRLGGAQMCHAGVGIVGHLAFNEPVASDKETFLSLGSRIVELTRETITINSNTALQGAYEIIPKRAVTLGMRQIYSSKRLRIYMNRPWQAAVLRKALLLDPTPGFPVTCVRDHQDISFMLTPEAAGQPEFTLR